MDSNKTHTEEAGCEQDRTTECCSEQILEGITYKTVAEQPLTSDLKKYPSKKNKICKALLEK